MITGYKLDGLGNTELLSGLDALVKRGNELTADLLAHLAEMDRRRLHLDLGYPSLFAYCVEKLRLSEPAAGRRIGAARVCRRFPEAFELVAKGDLHLSALCALQPHINPTSAPELFEACRNKTRRQVEELLARRFPGRDVPPSIRRLPQHKPTESATRAEPVVAPSPGEVVTSEIPKVEPATPAPEASAKPTARKPAIEPISPERYGVHFTATAALRDKIEQARALAIHRVGTTDLAALVELAFDALIRDLLKQRFAVGRKPRLATESLSPGDGSAQSRQFLRQLHEKCTSAIMVGAPLFHAMGAAARKHDGSKSNIFTRGRWADPPRPITSACFAELTISIRRG